MFSPLKSEALDREVVMQDEASPVALRHQKQAVLDLAERVHNGLFLYPAICMVLMLMLVDGYAQRHPMFVGINTACLVAITAGRLLYNRGLAARLEHHFTRHLALFRSFSLAHNLYWGVLCAILLQAPDAPNLRWMMLMCTVGITAGGTVIVAIDGLLPLIYPICTLAPTVITALEQGGSTNLGISGLALVMTAYSMVLSRLVSRDYWAKLQGQALLEQRARELEVISRQDALTQIPNRLRFQEALPQTWRDARRRHEPMAIAIVDLDHFKKINDTYGHPFGDLCLQAAARALTGSVHRPGDLVARFGGEEFVVLMANTDMAGASQVAERMLAAIRNTVVKQGPHVATLSCSIGVSMTTPQADQDDAQAEDLLQEADIALYFAKQHGRAQVACHGPMGEHTLLPTRTLT
jgi:diguanylate cyclase (GGDEF)-like protein